VPLALRARAQAHPTDGQFAPRSETPRGELTRADTDFVGGIVALLFFVCLGAALGLLGLLLRL